MPIVTTIAVPYSVMKEWLLTGDPLNRIGSLAQRHDKVWIASITNSTRCPDNETYGQDPTPLVQDGEDRVALVFDDIEPKTDRYSGVELGRDDRYIYFDETMAQKLTRFIRRAHASEGNDLFVVNCHMGVSRSGAVSDFVRTVCRIDYSEWRSMNRQANPNLLVKGLLTWAWSECNIES